MPDTVLITGASSGIGEAVAKLFLEKSWNVAAGSRSPANAGRDDNYSRLAHLKLDVTDETSAQAAIDAAVEHFGRIDVLVNNAGIGIAGPLEAVPQQEFESIFETNVFGVARTTRLTLPYLRQSPSAAIVNVSSITGLKAPKSSAWSIMFGRPFTNWFSAERRYRSCAVYRDCRLGKSSG